MISSEYVKGAHVIKVIRVKIHWRVTLQMRHFKIQKLPLVLATFQLVVSALKDFIASWIHFVNLSSTGNEKQMNPWCVQLSTALNSSISWNNSKNTDGCSVEALALWGKDVTLGQLVFPKWAFQTLIRGLEEYSVAITFA